MPCPHNEISIVQRSQQQSAVAAAAYQSGEKLFCEYDQEVKHYPEKRGIVHNEILLPANAPRSYADRNTLWNAAEAVEKQWNSQLARRWVLTIPREIPPDQYAVLVREFCEQQFVSKGMIADFAIHDPHPPGHNPHAHVLLTMRAMDEHGKWLPKSRKVYDLDENGERIKLPSGRWKSHKGDTVDWNDQKYCEIWRHEWEVIQNRYLEANDRPERVDLRSYTDKDHIHNHIYYNSNAYDRSRKFRNFIGSSFALRRLSDRVCLEHDLSVITNPKLHSKGRYLHYGQWLGENQKLSQKEQIRFAIDTALTERPVDFTDFLRRMETAGIEVKRGRGGVISFLVPGQQRAARFRASTLGDGYGPENVQAVIDGKAPTRKTPARRAPAPRRVNLLIDIQERMRQGKGPAYERWAKVYNLKQMAAALQYLKEHQLFEYDDLAAKTDAATERFHTLAGDIQQTEAELSRVSDLMAAVVQYAKTRPVFDGYKAAKYSRKYLAEHEAELADYRAAKATMAELLGGEKLPKMDVLKEKRRQLAARKKALYLEYRKAQQDMRELVAVKGSVDHLRGLTDNQRNKEQAR